VPSSFGFDTTWVGNKFVNSGAPFFFWILVDDATSFHIMSIFIYAAGNINTQLCLVDTLEKLGISSHFSCEISSILAMAYR
jgi:hypothetical protein